MNILTGNKIFLNTFLAQLEKVKRIKTNEEILILLSGGNTPKLFSKQLFDKVNKKNSNIIYSLTDERLVHRSSILSNSLIFKGHDNSKFISLSTEEGFVNEMNVKYLSTIKPSISIVGFGFDGHTLSIFTHEAVKSKYQITKKQNEEFKRISFTIDYVLESDHIFLLANDSSKINTREKFCFQK